MNVTVAILVVQIINIVGHKIKIWFAQTPPVILVMNQANVLMLEIVKLNDLLYILFFI